MARLATPRQVAASFNRMVETLEANLAARKAADAQKDKPEVEAVDTRPAHAPSVTL
jgi:hypothetical protein